MTLIATSLGFAVVQVDVSVVNVAIKSIGNSLGGSVSALQWVVSAYTLTFAASILSAGSLGDRIGAKRMFVFGFALFTVASAACGFAPSLAVLIAARGIQGFGAAILVPCSLTLLNHTFPTTQERVRAVGLWAAGASAGLSAGPLIGGVLTAAFGWRAIFFINAPVGLAGILLTLRAATETSRTPQRGIDVPGQLSAILCLSALAAAVIEGGAHGFGSPGVLSGFAVAMLAGAAFVTIERRSDRPMLPLGLFASRTFGNVTAIAVLINIAFYGLIFVLSLFLQQGEHHSALTTGLEFAPMTGVVILANVVSGRLGTRLGQGRLIAIGAALMVVGCGALVTVDLGTPYGAIVAQLMVIGFGLGLLVPTMTAALLGTVDRSRSGVAAGTLNSARQTGSVIGVALYGSLIAGGRLVAGVHLALEISVGLGSVVVALALGIAHGKSAGRF